MCELTGKTAADNKEEAVSRNFIEQMIDKDLAEGVYDTVHDFGKSRSGEVRMPCRSCFLLCTVQGTSVGTSAASLSASWAWPFLVRCI